MDCQCLVQTCERVKKHQKAGKIKPHFKVLCLFCLKLGPSCKPGFLFASPTMVRAWLEFFGSSGSSGRQPPGSQLSSQRLPGFHLFFIGGTTSRGHVSLYHTISARHPWCHLSLDWYHREAAPPSPGQDLVLNCIQPGAGTHFSIRNAMMRCRR